MHIAHCGESVLDTQNCMRGRDATSTAIPEGPASLRASFVFTLETQALDSICINGPRAEFTK